VSSEQSRKYEADTVTQNQNLLWFNLRKNRLTSSTAHKIYIRKRQFETLVCQLNNNTQTVDLPKFTQESLEHGLAYEPYARQKYIEVLKNRLNRNISVRTTGIVIQPNLFWLSASPDGLVYDEEADYYYGLIEIKCPRMKKHLSISECLNDNDFYIGLDNGHPYLKKDHHTGYYTQIQMAMGLSNSQFCDFVVYTFKGIAMIRTPFDNQLFFKLITKLNDFYVNYFLPQILDNNVNTKESV
jgi:hypothetical protein